MEKRRLTDRYAMYLSRKSSSGDLIGMVCEGESEMTRGLQMCGEEDGRVIENNEAEVMSHFGEGFVVLL